MTTIVSQQALQVETPALAERLADSLAPSFEVDALLYGSSVEQGQVVGDVDVWLYGELADVADAESRLRSVAMELSVRLDIVRSAVAGEPNPLDEPTRWCVHHEGIVLAGRRPESPPRMTYEHAEAAYRAAVRTEAARLAHRADVLARAAAAAAADFTEAAVRMWIRSMAEDHAEERLVRRMTTAEQLVRLQAVDEEAVELLSVHPWCSTVITTRLADTLL
jgi:hypothetical protein